MKPARPSLDPSPAPGQAELRRARRASRGLFWAVALFSLFINLLMLSGPLYMMQVYDRVLGSHSVETLVALTLLIAFLYMMLGVLDGLRGQVLARIGVRFHDALAHRVFSAVLRRSARDEAGATGLQDLEAVRALMASPVLGALNDLPWTPLFLLGISVFHPWMGLLAFGGGAVLILVTALNQTVTAPAQARAVQASGDAFVMAERLRSDAEIVQAMGLGENAFRRWIRLRRVALGAELRTSDVGGGFGAASRALRMLLQSAMLALGALLVLRQQVTPGAMLASSVMMGRALAPVEVLLAQWPVVQRGRRGWLALARLLTAVPPPQQRTPLPRPEARLEAQQATVAVPGEAVATLRMVSFALGPGEALGVIGPSGAGKSTLARAITGLWPVAGGSIRLAGAALDQYAPEDLASHIGYLPQRVQLFDGTIAENIARLSLTPDAQKVVAAAQMADAHEMILKMPAGYDTPVTMASSRLSGGQVQRIGLARALYGDPVILVLDEPNSNLDTDGTAALNRAVAATKAAGRSVLIMAHRPAAIQHCDTLLVLMNGTRASFGPKEQVLRDMVQNHEDISRVSAAGGGLR